MTNFDRFHREPMGVTGLGAFKYYISRLVVYFFDERPPCVFSLCPYFFLAGGVNALAGSASIKYLHTVVYGRGRFERKS